MTDVEGVLDKKGNLLGSLSRKQAQRHIKSKAIHGGMLPKVNCALNAVRNGVTTATISDGRVQHAVLLETFTREGVGTMIHREED